MKECKKWECGYCENDYETKEEALKCCELKKAPKLVYECWNCSESWPTEEDALKCCNIIEEVWYCGECCESYFEDEDGQVLAAKCCTDEEEDEEEEENWFKDLWNRFIFWISS